MLFLLETLVALLVWAPVLEVFAGQMCSKGSYSRQCPAEHGPKLPPVAIDGEECCRTSLPSKYTQDKNGNPVTQPLIYSGGCDETDTRLMRVTCKQFSTEIRFEKPRYYCYCPPNLYCANKVVGQTSTEGWTVTGSERSDAIGRGRPGCTSAEKERPRAAKAVQARKGIEKAQYQYDPKAATDAGSIMTVVEKTANLPIGVTQRARITCVEVDPLDNAKLFNGGEPSGRMQRNVVSLYRTSSQPSLGMRKLGDSGNYGFGYVYDVLLGNEPQNFACRVFGSFKAILLTSLVYYDLKQGELWPKISKRSPSSHWATLLQNESGLDYLLNLTLVKTDDSGMNGYLLPRGVDPVADARPENQF